MRGFMFQEHRTGCDGSGRGWSPWCIYPWKLFLMLCVVGGVALLYYPASHVTAHRSIDLMTPLDRAIPFIPWTWWIYFPHYLLGLLVSTLVVKDLRILYRVFVAILLVQVISDLFYLVVPSTFPRPDHVDGTGLTARAITWFWSVDPANNTFPSTHVAIAFTAALGVRRAGHPLWWYSLASATGVFITVHTAKQHYWIDAAAGVLVSLVAFNLVFRVLWKMPDGE